jgi:small subunit ribosomal protein S15
MYLTKEVKESIFEKHGKGKNDTGSSEGLGLYQNMFFIY